MASKKSEFGKIGKTDLLNALYHALGAAVFPAIGYLSAGRLPTIAEGYILTSVFLSAFCADVFKRALTNDQGEAFKK